MNEPQSESPDTALFGTPEASPPLIRTVGPLIRPVRPKWQRDVGITEFIEHLDQPDLIKIKKIKERWGVLNKADVADIVKIIDKCRKDFQFAARNFFYITTKDRREKLFSLWESQELILEYMMQLKARGLPQRVQIVKARQLGCSTLIEALIAWRTMFFTNVTAFVVADEPSRAAKLFGIMQYIYDRMPWWLKPEYSSREYKDGLILERKDPEERRFNPGLNSHIIVNSANKLTGVAQGYSVSAAHVSEYPSYSEGDARTIIEEDLGNALADNPETFAFLEGTGKGAGTYAHKLWLKNVDLGDDAKWFPKFLPWFFEVNRVRPTQPGWEPEEPEAEMRERAEKDWVRCTNNDCLQYQERWVRGEDRHGTRCPTCQEGLLQSYRIKNEQLAWMAAERKSAQGDVESLKNLNQEMCLTPTQAFALGGQAAFSSIALNWVEANLAEPYALGMIDKQIKFHGCDPNKRVKLGDGNYWNACFQANCGANHRRDDSPVTIWEWPERGAVYVIGADVSEGLGGESNYSVAVVLKIGKLGEADEQVARFRSNTADRIGYAQALFSLGLFYNRAMIAVEINKFDTVASWLQAHLRYPNCYKPRTPAGQVSAKLSWETTEKTKRYLIDTLKRWLEYKHLIIRSRNFAEEMKTFRATANEKGTGYTYAAEVTFNDDECMATMIALFIAHEHDYDENLGYIIMRADLSMANAPWHMACERCGERWPAVSIQQREACPKCGSIRISGSKNPEYDPSQPAEPEYGDMLQRNISAYNDAWSALEQGLPGVPEKAPAIDYDLL